MFRLHHNQIHIPVDTTIHIKISQQRHDIQLYSIVHPHHKRIFLSVIQPVSQIYYKCSISSPMLQRMLAIYKDIGNGVYSLKTQKHSLPLPVFRNFHRFFIITNSPVIISLPGQCIRIPGVG